MESIDYTDIKDKVNKYLLESPLEELIARIEEIEKKNNILSEEWLFLGGVLKSISQKKRQKDLPFQSDIE